MLLLIHIFIYVPIIHVHVLIPMFCHLLLISIFLIIYAFLSCVPSNLPSYSFCMSIIYSYHLRIPVMSSSIHILSIFLSCSIYSFVYDNHMFTSYNLIFICVYHSCTLDYHILCVAHTCSFSYTFPLLLCSCSCSYFISFSCFISYSCFLGHIYTYCIFYIFLVSWLLHIALHILIKYDVYEIILHIFIFLYESTLLRNWNHSN